MCHRHHHHIIQTRDLAVSRATVEGLRLLWQLRKGDVLCNASSQSSSQRKTMWLARTGEPSSLPIQSSLSRSSQPAVIWSGVRMLMKCIRLIEQIPVIWKSIWAQIEKQVILKEREAEGEGEKERRKKENQGKLWRVKLTTIYFMKIKNVFIELRHNDSFPLWRI